jgi:hypothetical protein
MPSTVSQADLERFGVAPEVAVELKQITTEDALQKIIEALPASQGNAVLDLAFGKDPQDVWNDLVLPEGVDVATQRPFLVRAAIQVIEYRTWQTTACHGPEIVDTVGTISNSHSPSYSTFTDFGRRSPILAATATLQRRFCTAWVPIGTGCHCVVMRERRIS